MNILSVMAEPNSKRRMCIETAVQQITAALEKEDDEDILGGSRSNESDLSDEDDPTYVAPTLETSYSDTEVTIGSTYLNDYESKSEKEDESPLNISPSALDTSLSASDKILWTGKDGTFWNSTSSPEGRYGTHNVIRTRLHTVASSEVYSPKNAIHVFFSDNIFEEILLCTNLQGRRDTTQWNAIQMEEFLAFVGSFLLPGVEKNRDLDTRQLFLDPKQNLTYKAAFGVNRFKNIRRHLQFDDKRARAEKPKQDKLAAFNNILGLFIQNCNIQFSLGAYTTVDEQLVPFRGQCPFTQYVPSKPVKYGIKIFCVCDASLPYAFNAKIFVGRQPGSSPEKNLSHNVAVNLTAPLLGLGRNVSMDNFFTSVPVARTLLQHQLTVVGTMRKCKREIPVCMKAAKSRQTSLSFWFQRSNDDGQLCSQKE